MFLHLSASISVHGGVSLKETPWTETPPEQRPLYSKERVIRILLECILVDSISHLMQSDLSGGSRIFPRGGVNPPGGHEHAKFSRKLHEIERIWTPRGGMRPSHPP